MAITEMHDVPGTRRAVIHLPAQTAAAATAHLAQWTAPFACRITGIGVSTVAAVTGQDTDSRNLNVDLGSGTEIANLDLESGTDVAVTGMTPFTLTGTTAELELAQGATLRFESEKVGSGLAVAAGCVEVQYQAR